MKNYPVLLVLLSFFMLPQMSLAGEDSNSKVISLSEVIGIAMENHPNLREAADRERIAKATVDDARAAREVQVRADSKRIEWSKISEFPATRGFPQISFGEKDLWNSSLTAQKVLSSGGKIESAIRQAKSQTELARLGSRRTMHLIAFEAERAFLQLVSAQRELEVASQALDTAGEYLRVANTRFEMKSAAKFDVLRAEVQLQESRQDFIRAQSGIQIAHAGLIQALALPGGAFTATETGIIGAKNDISIEDALKIAYSQRPELQSSEWNIKSAEAGIALAKSENKPTLSFSADYQRYEPESTTQLNRWSTVIAAGIPLFDGGSSRAKVRAAKARLSQQTANRDGTKNQVEKEVRQAHARMNSAAAQVAVAEKRVQFAEEMLRITHVRYSSGMSTATEVADAQTSLTRARQGYTRAISDLRLADAEFRLATGVFEPPSGGRAQVGGPPREK